MAGLLNKMLEGDRLEEAYEIAILAIGIADHISWIDNEWYWQVKGDLARVHQVKGN